jgi:hypothetical protein
MSYDSHKALADEVEREIANDFNQRGLRLLPLTQADVEAALAKAEAQLQSTSRQELNRGARLSKSAARVGNFINDVQLSSGLIDALNRRRAPRDQRS